MDLKFCLGVTCIPHSHIHNTYENEKMKLSQFSMHIGVYKKIMMSKSHQKNPNDENKNEKKKKEYEKTKIKNVHTQRHRDRGRNLNGSAMKHDEYQIKKNINFIQSRIIKTNSKKN